MYRNVILLMRSLNSKRLNYRKYNKCNRLNTNFKNPYDLDIAACGYGK